MLHTRMHKLAFSVLLFAFLNGCGSSAIRMARSTVYVVGEAYIDADGVFSEAYKKARENARSSSSTWEERDAKIKLWDDARSALIAAGFALKTAALSISIADDGFKTDWKTQTIKALVAIDSAFKALDAVGIHVSRDNVTAGIYALERQ